MIRFPYERFPSDRETMIAVNLDPEDRGTLRFLLQECEKKNRYFSSDNFLKHNKNVCALRVSVCPDGGLQYLGFVNEHDGYRGFEDMFGIEAIYESSFLYEEDPPPIINPPDFSALFGGE